MAWLDRLFKRAEAPRRVRMLEGASGKRWDRTPPFGTLGQEIGAGAAAVRGRARHLRHNDAIASQAATVYRSALVGFGPSATSQHPGAAMRAALDAAFAHWAQRTRFAALLAEVVDTLVTDGESLLIMGTDAQGDLRLQHVPCELLDETLTRALPGGGFIVQGVEHDADGEITAFHILPSRDPFATSVRVDAADVVHVFKKQGAAQARGLSWFSPVILSLNEHAQLTDALLVNAKIQSMLAGFVEDTLATGGGGAFDDANGFDPASLSLEPGTIRRLPPGHKITFSSPAQALASNELVGSSLRAIAAGLAIPSFMLSHDMASVNYSSARVALTQFKAHVEAIQFTLIAPALDRVWRRWLALSNFDATPEAARVEWMFPPMSSIDPLKETNATIRAIEAGLMSRKQAVASMGGNIDALDAEIAADPRAQKPQNGVTK